MKVSELVATKNIYRLLPLCSPNFSSTFFIHNFPSLSIKTIRHSLQKEKVRHNKGILIAIRFRSFGSKIYVSFHVSNQIRTGIHNK